LSEKPVFTVGHSNRSLDELLELLREAKIGLVVDVRSLPGSRRHPHFSRDALARALASSGIAYRHEPALGGLRRPRPDSVHVGWASAGFRGYADHMETDEFQGALDALVELAAGQPTALLCAEAVPWRCHRSLIADALVARGVEVVHLIGPGRRGSHVLTAFARVSGGRLVYDGLPQRRR